MSNMTIIDAPDRETPRHHDDRFAAQEHTTRELSLDAGETEAERRGISDARNARLATPGEHIDAYMSGYETELIDLGDSWEG